MFYQKFTSAPSLRPFVECYFVGESPAAGTRSVESPPNGFGAMAFNYGEGVPRQLSVPTKTTASRP